MKTLKLLGGLTLALCLFVVTLPGQALATYADAWSYIEKDSISFVFTGSSETSCVHDDQVATHAVAGRLSDSDTVADLGHVESVAEIDPDTYWGWGLSDRDDLFAGAFIQDHGGMAYGDAGYMGSYTSLEAGTLTISFDYVLAYDVAADPQDSAFVDSWVELYMGEQSTSSELTSEAINGMAFFDETTLMTLSLSMELGKCETINFKMLTAAQAEICPVPLPGAIWLLASALPIMATLRGRKSKA